MVTINLRDFYKELYTRDCFVDVPDEVEALLLQLRVEDENDYRNRKRRNKRRGHFSLNEHPDLEASACIRQPNVEELAEESIAAEKVHKAISTLSEKQARRIIARHIGGLSIKMIAEMEKVHKSQISRSISQGEKKMKKFLKTKQLFD